MHTASPSGPARAGSRRKAASEGTRVRPDIQGLRALAVVVVVLDHLTGWPSGGFIGVDIFFVISGFLITGLLLREYEKTGRISFGDFYRRRIKRIIPASAAAIVATLLGAFAIFGPSRFLGTAQDGGAAALFGANWRFAAGGTDYFRAGVPVSPLQHFWSLSVEEQFYFVWPAVMLLVLALVARHPSGGRSRARVGAGLMIGLISAASFAWALWETQSSPTQAYFSTFSRAWELGAGAALACAAPLCSRLAPRVRPLLAWLGMGLMLAALFLIDSSSAFPAPWALLPVLGAVLVILAGTGAEHHAFLLPLTNPVSGYLGNISYSLYLWHFPVVILGGAVFLNRTPLFYLGCAAAMLLLAVFSYHLIEDPVRRSTWLSGWKARAGGTTTADRRTARGAGFRRAAAATALTAVVCAVSIPHIPAHSRSIQLSNTPAVDVSEETAALQEQIRAALRSSDWPELDPTIDEAMNGQLAPADITACGGTGSITVSACTWGDPDATRRVVVVGDSIAISWTSALREAVGSTDGWAVTGLGTSGCTFTELLIRNPSARLLRACEGRKEQVVEAINDLRPDVVIIANTYEPRFPMGRDESLSTEEWKDSTASIVSRFSDSVGSVVFLSPPPLTTDIQKCYSKIAEPSFCAGQVRQQWRTFATAEQELAGELNGSFISPELWFCAEGWCPSFVGSTPVMRDLVHMTPSYQLEIAPALRSELLDRGILRSRQSSPENR
ncbi:MAG: acyltransferase [Micrococcaceae bacterium]|jgi:peptidoglycan/LPS O-acetylase OafA/YrhL|nr:acyltransferase [Micrococcaceae bacterium]